MTGWICPRCNRGLSPFVVQCPCYVTWSGGNTTDFPTLVPTPYPPGTTSTPMPEPAKTWCQTS